MSAGDGAASASPPADPILTGGCQCGALRFTLTGRPLGVILCHCRTCQAQSASAFGMSVYVRAENFRLEGTPAVYRSPAASGTPRERLFCPACGTRICHTSPADPFVSVKGGTLDPEQGPGHDLAPVAELWTDRRHPWLPPLPGLLQYPREPDDMAPIEAAFATRSFYDGAAGEYATWSEPEAVPEDLERFLARFAPGSALLDLGCGGGWAAAEMQRRGMRVAAIDAAPGLAAEAEARTGIPVRVGRVEAFDDSAAHDGIWAYYSLQHAARAAMPGILAALHRALRPGGRLLIGIQAGDRDLTDSLGRHYSYYLPGELTGLLTAAGFHGIEIRMSRGAHYDGTPCDQMTVEARRDA